ncbi:ras-related protein Rap-1-like [Glandiceps talaboti]
MFSLHRHFKCRVIVKGPTACGKTSVVQRMLYGLYSNKYIPTVEDHYYVRTFHPSCGKLTLDVVDTSETCGRNIERQPTSMADGDIFMFVYSVDDSSSFVAIMQMMTEMIDRLGENLAPMLVIGNKSDLSEKRSVDDDVVQQLQSFGVQHLYVSSKLGHHMNDLVSLVVKMATKRGKFIRRIKTSIKKKKKDTVKNMEIGQTVIVNTLKR